MDCFIIEDELVVAQSICEYFRLFELTCDYAVSYEEGLAYLKEHPVSLLLLDINLGEESGFALCKEIRKQYDFPILFLSALSSDSDVLTAIGVGGDDLIAKPFSLAVLYARVNAILKREQIRGEKRDSAPSPDCPVFGDIIIDFQKALVKKDKDVIKLKPMEWRLLVYLLDHKNRVISKEELLTQVWQETYIGEGTLSVHIRHLREKLEINPNKPVYIKTVWGTGYMLEIQ